MVYYYPENRGGIHLVRAVLLYSALLYFLIFSIEAKSDGTSTLSDTESTTTTTYKTTLTPQTPNLRRNLPSIVKDLDNEEFTSKSNNKQNSTFTDKKGTSLITDEQPHDGHFPVIKFPLGKAGHLIFPALITLYLLLCLTIVCDCFLVPCIQAISIKVDLSFDVAGATLMAAASSSPEFFINILGTFLIKSDVGVGTVLGTGLYALMIVPALCILLNSNKVLKVDYWPITRDSFAYCVSILVLVLILADGRIYYYEALILIAIYFCYLIVLRYNLELRYYLEMLALEIHRRRYAHQIDEPTRPLLLKPGRPPVSMSVEDVFYVLEDHTPEFYTMGRWPLNCSLYTKVQWLLMWPIITVLRMTIPTYWSRKFQHIYMITFVMCVAWIGVICYCIAWMIITIGNEINVPDSVMGLTLLAAGMSIPETISGVIVANQGYGTMALCNALGSNTFAILICLGVPWLIKTLSSYPHTGYLTIGSQGTADSSFIVLIALLVTYMIFLANKFYLKRKIGWLCILLYIVFISVGIYIELQYFWHGK